MLSKSALMAAVAGGVTTAMVIAMAAGLSPKGAAAHGNLHDDPHAQVDGHGPEEHGGTATKEHAADGHGGGEQGAGGHAPGGQAEPDAHAAPAKPSAKTPKAAPAKAPATGHGDKPAADPHAGAKADPHGAPKADAHPDPKADSKTDSKADPHADPHADAQADPHASVSVADDALRMLMEGNERWAASRTTDPNTDAARRKEVAEAGQKPFATILTCADSRLPVERMVDRGVGEVFVVRVAGAIAGTSETGTIEYGLEHLHTPLLVVMGHTKCGAVAAAASGAEVHGHIQDIVDAIEPAVDRAKRKNPGLEGAELAAAAVKENVWQSVFALIRESKDIRTLVGQGKVKVVGAVCDISTGKIEWLGEHPWQQEMIDALGGVAAAEKPGEHGK